MNRALSTEGNFDEQVVELSNGTKIWQLNGKLHRVDGPAVKYPSGTKEWYLDGKRHRVDGPAVEWSDGEKHWYFNGEHHRIDGPAVEWSNKEKHWYLNGKRHRVGGPAVEYLDGTKIWYLNGQQIRQSEYYAFLTLRKIRSRVFRLNYALGFNFSQMLSLSRNRTVVEWYYSPDKGGGKVAKKRIEYIISV